MADDTSKGATCQYCGKKVAHLRSIASHEKGCKENPANQQQAHIREHECRCCNAAYFHKKDLNRHIKSAHCSVPH